MSPRQQLASNLPYWSAISGMKYIHAISLICHLDLNKNTVSTKVINVISLTVPQDCCDPIASCSCGTHTGHFACVCPAGFYGRGLVGDCKSRSFQFIYSLRARLFAYTR